MIELFEHNKKAYDAAVAMLNDVGKAAIVHPTGTGKSFIGFKLCEDNPDKTICWLSPSDYIFKTQLENLAKVSSGYQPKNIKFLTYAKLINLSEGELSEICPDYIVLDEFHRCGAQEWGKGVSDLLEFYEDTPVLGMSATNIRYLDNQRDMAVELFDGNIASEMTLGEAVVRGILSVPKYIVSVYSYQQELEKYYKRVGYIKNKAVKDKAEKYLEALRRALDKADGLDAVFAKHMIDRTGKYIVFCANFEHMQEMMDKAEQWFANVDPSPRKYSVYSADPTASRSFLDFKADNDTSHLRLLYCIDALNEGIHVDDISGVILFRPTVSPIIYKQQIGRALAANKCNTPIIFDIVNNFDNLYSISAIEEEMTAAINCYRFFGDEKEIVNERFKIIDEVKDCKQLFDELNDTLSASWDIMYSLAKQYYAEHGDLVPENKYKTGDGYSLGSWLNTQRMIRRGTADGYLSEEQIAKLDAIGMRWETKKDCSWNKNFAELLKYYEEHGDIDIPYRYKSDSGVALGKWISKLRIMYNFESQRTVLTDERIESLNKLGMIWDKIDNIWESYYQALLNYYQENGNMDVPKKYRTDDGLALGVWVRNLKRNYRTSYGESLNHNQIERLKLLGLDLSYEFYFEKTWEKNYDKAKKYYEEHGHLCVPAGYITDDGIALGKWISRLRAEGKKKDKSSLTTEMLKALDVVGMVWKDTDTLSWEQHYTVLLEYYKEHGHIRMTSKTVYQDIALGTWLAGKRTQYRKGTLSECEKTALDSLGMDWLTLKERQWEEAFSMAVNFYYEHGNLKVPREMQKLYSWISNQRLKYRQDSLTITQRERLSSIGMIWEFDDTWALHYEKAKEFYLQHGNLDIPSEFETKDGIKLGRWYRARLQEYQKDLLPQEKAEQLELIGIQKESVIKRNWMSHYDCAKNFYKQNGHLSVDAGYVTDNGIKLGTWISTQRGKYKLGRLTKEQISMLEDIEMHWDRFEERWESNYDLAVDYFNEHGNILIPANYETSNGVKLGAWIITQRNKYKSNKLSKIHIEQLEKLGMVWNPSDRVWEEGYRHAEEYSAKYGNLNIETDYICDDGFKLFSWVQNKRTAYKKGKISCERIHLLDNLGMRWDSSGECLKKLLHFKGPRQFERMDKNEF